MLVITGPAAQAPLYNLHLDLIVHLDLAEGNALEFVLFNADPDVG
jgi:hypothetical protein